ncbi:MAG: guanylate kinase [Candidatus Electrothrix sp. AW2]|nr:guanylate kinase [Candidatus Electrothrix sp. AX1]MCI5128133.1 guanylate kinase [Candidatus Electrothrix gigas]MCI5133908.1 guanylate kinase [Candidatus Electrothrix gigas]MCI5183349.1 guanylate kinase [Candidatus Electrothrix gigas]MCI5190413.1 guanylate kinase [Candidatus Electrothrix gigas]
MAEGILLVVSAPSGCGKTTILKKLMTKISNLEFSVSHTTRQPRRGEQDGKDYHFVTEEEFIALRDQQPSGFLEWAEVHGNLYGTSRQAVEEIVATGKDVVLDIDIQGADQVRENANPVTVFISPPTPEELERRLRKRGTETPEDIDSRLANAESEMAAASRYRYLIINDELEQAVRDLQAIVVAERRRQNTAQVKRSVLKD